MSEISTVAIITVKPESADEAEAILTELAAETQAEDGCIRYSLHRAEEPGVFVTIEKWDRKESLDAHLASSHIAKAIGAATPLLTKPLQIVPAVAIPLDSPKADF